MKNFIFVFVMFLFVTSCKIDFVEEELENLTENEFLIIPDQPKSTDEVYMVDYCCTYYALRSVNVSDQKILVEKYFNGMMKLPCEIGYDTIPLGILSKGTYEVTLQIIDISSMAFDSIYSEEKISLTVND